MTWQDIPGWSDDIAGADGFYAMMQARIPRGGIFVEAGVFMGRSLACMGEMRPDVEIYAIDPWNPGLGVGERWDTLGAPVNYESKLHELGARGLFGWLLKTHSPDVYARAHIIQSNYTAATHPPADLVFIDGLHDERCYDDIAHASAMLKPGGVICGHDYLAWDNRTNAPVTEWPANPAFPGVVTAVDKWAREHGQKVRFGGNPKSTYSSCWWLE